MNMEATKGSSLSSSSKNPSLSRHPQLSDPIVLGVAAGVLGFVIGSGRWNWLTGGASRVAQSLGTLAITYVYESFQRHNPQLFSGKPRVTH